MNDVLEHIIRQILGRALAESRRVIAHKGRICLEFPPWTSRDAGHLYDYIYLPWCQLIFSSKTLVNVLRRISHMPGGRAEAADIRRVTRLFQELNRLTIGEFNEIVKQVGFKVINYDLSMIGNLAVLKHIPILNRYLTLRVVAVLAK